jgi:isochorismate synthase
MTNSAPTYHQIRKLQSVLLQQNIPFASYRLPMQEDIITLVQHQSLPEKLASLNEIDKKVGFVIAPFTVDKTHETYLLKPDSVFLSDEIEDSNIQEIAEYNRFLQLNKQLNNLSTTPNTAFVTQANMAIEAMKNGEFHKVVLSKVRIEELSTSFNAANFYLKLCKNYPHAFVYILQLPEVGCWIGATPEPLLVIEDKVVKTVSLAGTQMATSAEIESYKWASKEIEEQEIVTDFVEKTLHSLGVIDYSKIGPMNYQAANLIHLKTAFEFKQNHLQNKLGDFLKGLHPTPSVGGLPKVETLNFILKNEKHNRSYYTGFLGPLNINKKTNIFVNLRCLQLFEKQFVLYSGAGITASSVAENEWTETDNKMMTLMNVMNS